MKSEFAIIFLMKKTAARTPVFLFVILITSALLVSCLTLGDNSDSYTEQEAETAMKTALHSAIDNLPERMKHIINSYSFFPEEYNCIIENSDNIPGMRTAVKKWNEYVCGILLADCQDVQPILNGALDNMKIIDPVGLVSESNRSGTEYFIANNRGLLRSFIVLSLNNLDTALFKEAVEHYNAWVTVSNATNNTQLNKLIMSDYTDFFIERSHDCYIESLSEAEELFRTTPDPFADGVSKKVFGLN